MSTAPLPEMYSIREVAEAAGATEAQVRLWLPNRTGGFVSQADAIRIVRALRSGTLATLRDQSGVGGLLVTSSAQPRSTTLPLVVSTTVHGLVFTAILVIAGLGLTTADERTEVIAPPAEPIRLVYLALPGPGGGGGGGGLRMPTPATKAERKGTRSVTSPIPARRLPPPVAPPPPKPEPPPPPLEAKTLPPVMAPVATIAADTRNQEGVMSVPPKPAPPSQGAGEGGGSGSGKGTGLGEGDGAGIGPGEGGGTGGGPYRPGSGVEPPRLLKEVRADYTDEARRANIAGEVVLEIVVRRDGTVGDVKVLRRLGAGLDQRAIDAVRQWRFSPARMRGTPVDVVVEVAVEFKLR